MNYKDAHAELLSICGIGPKVGKMRADLMKNADLMASKKQQQLLYYYV